MSSIQTLYHATEPRAPDVLYHYCTTETFVSIVTNRSVRLSALSMSNDSEEGRLVHRLIDELGSFKGSPHADIDALKARWNEVVGANEGFGFCLSEKRDLLSQWRGYAALGKGVCIGFSTDYLRALCGAPSNPTALTLEKVVYAPTVQARLFMPTHHHLMTTLPHDLTSAMAVAAWSRRVYTFKGEGFAEEQEWRLLTLFSGRSDEDCRYRAADDKIVAFREVSLVNPGAGAIVSVTLGPKHVTPVSQVGILLRRHGFPAEVSKSSLTYR